MTNEAITFDATLAQAFAAIVALVLSFLAILVPAIQQAARNKREDQEQKIKAKCLATSIRFSLHDIQVVLGKTRILATGQSFLTGTPNALPVEYQYSKVEIPATLLGSLDQFYLLGEIVGPMLLRFIAVLESYNQAVDLQVNQSFTDPTFPVADRWKRLIGFIQDVEPKVVEALKSVSAIADS